MVGLGLGGVMGWLCGVVGSCWVAVVVGLGGGLE